MMRVFALTTVTAATLFASPAAQACGMPYRGELIAKGDANPLMALMDAVDATTQREQIGMAKVAPVALNPEAKALLASTPTLRTAVVAKANLNQG